MVDIGEIKDRESFERWLNALPKGTEAEKKQAQRWAVTLAHRAAMRVLPVALEWCFRKSAEERLTALSILRACLTSGVAAEMAFEEAFVPAVNATQWLDARSKSLSGSDDVTAVAVISARSAVRGVGKPIVDAIISSVHAVDCASVVSEPGAEFWESVRADAGANSVDRALRDTPLWFNQNTHYATWDRVRASALAEGIEWQFWVQWYGRVMRGQPQDWDLLTRIALIDPKDWEQGVDHVNALIAEIRLDHITQTRPLGEDAIAKGEDGIWHRVGRSGIDRDILQDACDRVADTVKRIRKSMKTGQGNALTALTDDLKLLDAVLRRYRDRPLRLHDTFLQVQRHIARDLARHELPDDHLVDDLRIDLGTAALDMRNACPKTAQVVAARASARFGALDERERTAIVQLAEAAASLSDGPLAAEFTEDAADATNPTAPPEDVAPAQYRLTTRLAKIFTHDGRNLVDALIQMGAIKAGVDAFSSVAFAILALIL